MKHEALGASGPPQAEPPVGSLEKANSPVRIGAESVAVVGVRLVRVKIVGALELCTATGPKSCWVGVSRRPVSGSALPVSESV
jgi:hypothetical protein